MNERINELRKQVSVDMHLHNLEDFRAMSGCFGLEGGNKIVDDYLEKFAELIVREAGALLMSPEFIGRSDLDWSMVLNEHFGVEE